MKPTRKKLDFTKCEHEALRIGNGWIVRPKGQLGTVGSFPYLWEAVFVRADNERDALRKARGGAEC